MGREPFKHSLGVPVPCLTSEPAVPVFPPATATMPSLWRKTSPDIQSLCVRVPMPCRRRHAGRRSRPLGPDTSRLGRPSFTARGDARGVFLGRQSYGSPISRVWDGAGPSDRWRAWAAPRHQLAQVSAGSFWRLKSVRWQPVGGCWYRAVIRSSQHVTLRSPQKGPKAARGFGPSPVRGLWGPNQHPSLGSGGSGRPKRPTKFPLQTHRAVAASTRWVARETGRRG